MLLNFVTLDGVVYNVH